MTREELKAALRTAADDYKRATDEAVAAYAASYEDDPELTWDVRAVFADWDARDARQETT